MPPRKKQKKVNDNLQKFNGLITSCKGNGFFDVKVKIGEEEKTVLCKVRGLMSQRNIRVILGDSVDIEIDISDVSKGRITYRR